MINQIEFAQKFNPIIHIAYMATMLIVLLSGCQKDDIQPYERPEMKLNMDRPLSHVETNFFDIDYIISENEFLQKNVSTRDGQYDKEVLLDSLYNYLVSRNLTDPFVENLVDVIGYPVWSYSEFDSTSAGDPVVLLPFANVFDEEISGFIYCIQLPHEWLFMTLNAGELRHLIQIDSLQEPSYFHLPAMNVILFDHDLFEHADTNILDWFWTEYHLDSIGTSSKEISNRCGIDIDICTTTCVPLQHEAVTGDDRPIEVRYHCEVIERCIKITGLGCGESYPKGGPMTGSIGGPIAGPSSGGPYGGGGGAGSKPVDEASDAFLAEIESCSTSPSQQNQALCLAIDLFLECGGDFVGNTGLMELLDGQAQGSNILTMVAGMLCDEDKGQDYSTALNSYWRINIQGLINTSPPPVGISFLESWGTYVKIEGIKEYGISFTINENDWLAADDLNGGDLLDAMENFFVNNNAPIPAPAAMTKAAKAYFLVAKHGGFSSLNDPDIPVVLEPFQADFEDLEVLYDEKFGEASDPMALTFVSWVAGEYVYLIADCELDPNCDATNSLKRSELLLTAYWHVFDEAVHVGLDVIGLVPGLGDAIDIFHGVIYLIQGNETDAAFTFTAAIPFGGWVATSAKDAKKVVKHAGKAWELPIKVLTGGVVHFGSKSNSKLRKVMGITNPLNDAHHIIPWQKCKTHPLVQRAAGHGKVVQHDGKDWIEGGWHMDQPSNGIEVKRFTRNQVDPGQHATHPNYDNQVFAKLTSIYDDLVDASGNVDGEDALQAHEDFQSYLRNLIQTNPDKKINLLVIDYTP